MAEPVDDAMLVLATADGVERNLSLTMNATAVSSSSNTDSVFQSIDRYVTPVWYVLGIPGNLLAYCVWMQPKMRRSSGIYLASLALDECLFLVMQARSTLYNYYCYLDIIDNKYERYYGPGRRSLAYLLYYNAYGKPRLPPAHKYSSLRSTTHRAAACSTPLR